MKKLFIDQYGDVKIGLVAVVGAVALAATIFLITAFNSFYQIVPPSHEGLVIKGGELQQEALPNGFYLKAPFWTVIEPVFIGTQTTDDETEELNAFRGIQPLSKDGQVMDIDMQINYQIVNPVLFREKTGAFSAKKIEELLFIPTSRRLVYDYTSEYGWKALIQGGDRQELGQRIYKTVTTGVVTKRVCKNETKTVDSLTGAEVIIEAGCTIEEQEKIQSPEDFGVVVTAVNLRKVKPNDAIIKAVETTQKKEQEVKIAEQEKAIAKENADKLIEVKRGETESRKLEVAAEAYKKQVDLEALGEGLKAEAAGKRELAVAERELASALSNSAGLIEYKRIEVELKLADAQLEFAKNYKGEVPQQVTILGDKASENNRLLFGMPQVSVIAGQE